MAKKYFIQAALKRHKKGALHRELGIPRTKRIPDSLLYKIERARVGSHVKNPTETGRPRYRVTRLLKERATLAHTLRSFKRRRR